jgi:autotransporter-associated beta strand protein
MAKFLRKWSKGPTTLATDARRRLRAKPNGSRRGGPVPEKLQLEPLEARFLPAGFWTPLAHTAPVNIGPMILLSDGTVMAQQAGCSNNWYRLTPDASGSYINGTWSSLQSMGLQRLYYASNVLPSGKVFVQGGEYSGSNGNQNWTNTGEIYDPVANAWSNIANFPQSQFGDDPSEVLPDGRVLGGYLSGTQTYIYNPSTNAWSFAANKLHDDRSDEETWLKLPDGSILSYDIFASVAAGKSSAQRFIPSQNQWVDASGTNPFPLLSSSPNYELGPAFLLPDGRAFFLGDTGHTAFYTPSTNTWAAGPDLPNGASAGDSPGAMLPDGDVLFNAQSGSTRHIWEFNPTTNVYTDADPGVNTFVSYPFMLVLPSGQVLLSYQSNQLEAYTPSASPSPTWQPVVTDIARNSSTTVTLTGTQINGISQGASFGDDAEMDTNYPIVQVNLGFLGNFYLRTFNWSSTGVAEGSKPESVQFQLGTGSDIFLHVIANGIPSDTVLAIEMSSSLNNITLRRDPNALGNLEILNNGSFFDSVPFILFNRVMVTGNPGTNNFLTVDYGGLGRSFPTPVDFHGGSGGINTLKVTDAADPSSGTWTLSGNSIVGAPSGALNGSITYNLVEFVTFEGSGGGGAVFDKGSSAISGTAINSTGPTTVFVTVGSEVGVYGAPGSTTLTVDDSTSPTHRTVQMIVNGTSGVLSLSGAGTVYFDPTALSSLKVQGGTGGDAFIMQTVAGMAPVNLDPGTGAAGSLTKNGSGLLTLFGFSNYTGATLINAGTLRAGNHDAVPVSSALTVSAGATFDLNGLVDSIGSLAGAGNVTLGNGGYLFTGANGSSTTFSGFISGPGGVIDKVGSGTFTLASNGNTYSGVTKVEFGTLRISVSYAVPATSPVFISGGTFDLNGNTDTIASLTGGGSVTLGGGTLATGGDNTSTTFSGVISGSGSIVKEGTGTFTLSGANTYSGNTRIAAGHLRLGANNALPSTTAVSMGGLGSASTTLELNNFNDTIGSLSLVLFLGNEFVMLGTGTLTTGGDNTSTAFDGIISGTGRLTKVGTGTFSLFGNNTYTGETTVQAGTLFVAGSQPGSPVFVNGGTLSGTGTVGSITVNSPGNVNAGSSTFTGILHSNGTATFNAGSSLGVRINGLNAGSGYDQVTVSGAVDLTHQPALNASLGFNAMIGQGFTILTGSSITGQFSGLPQDAGLTIGGARFQIHYNPTSVVLTRVAGPATQYLVSAPSTSQAGTPFDVTVSALDPDGNIVQTYVGTVHFTTSDPTGGILPDDYTFTAADSGVHTFGGGVTLYTAGDETLTVTDINTGINQTVTVTVTPAPANHFQVAAPAQTIAGAPFDLTVTARDPYGNTDPSYRGTVQFTTSDPAGGRLPAAYTFTSADGGTHTFAGGATLFTAGTWAVTAIDLNISATGSAFVVVTPAPAVVLVIAAPASAPSGSPFDITVTAEDPYGNTDTNYQGTITFTSSDTDPNVVLPADYTFTAGDAGSHTFPGGVTLITLGAQIITATDTVSGITGSATVTVTQGPVGPDLGSWLAPAQSRALTQPSQERVSPPLDIRALDRSTTNGQAMATTAADSAAVAADLVWSSDWQPTAFLDGLAG